MFSVPLEQLASVTARMAYTEASERAHIRVYPPSSGKKMDAPRRERHDMPVYDMRTVVHELEVDVAGFSLARAPTQFADFFDSNAVKQDYYPDVVEVLKKHLGALEVFVFDHNVRSKQRASAGQSGVREPVDGAHNDYTLASGPRRIREVLEENSALHLSEHRAALINVWRPIRGPVQDHPLAICDARTTSIKDFIPTAIEHYSEDDLTTPSLTGEVYSFSHSEEHRWFYASDMQPDEVLLLKCFDTANDGRALFTGHTGFRNPGCPEDFLPRESIEARTVVIYPNSD